MTGARTWILEQLDAERGRWMLWLPVAMGLGIAVYFELPSEPALWLGPAVAAARMRRGRRWRPAAARRGRCASASSRRRSASGWRPGGPPSLAAPTLSRPLFSINVEGRIADIQRLPEGVRVVLEAVRLKGNHVPPLEMMPARVAGVAGQGRAAARASATGCWCWPTSRRRPGPAAPGAFDFQRVAWYQQLGAVGYALAPAVVIEHGQAVRHRAHHRRRCAPTSPSAS